jgi:hypothetical protein
MYICIVSYKFLSFCFLDVYLFMSSFSLWKMSSESLVYFGFADDTSWHTHRISSTHLEACFSPRGQLLSSRGICLGDSTNNVSEYNAVT